MNGNVNGTARTVVPLSAISSERAELEECDTND